MAAQDTGHRWPGTFQALSVSQVFVRANVRGQPMKPFYKDITVTRVFESPGQADGTATGPRTHHRVAWTEQSLVIESGSHSGPAPESAQWT
jgi:hypothetical protein